MKYFLKNKLNNKGTTLIEMVVCFALMAIFLVSATSVITLISKMYYEVKGETYARQVSDIVMERISAELEGAKYEKDSSDNPVISSDNSSIDLYNRTDTHIKLYESDGLLELYYYDIVNSLESDKSRKATVWRFDENVYNGYTISELRFISGSDIADAGDLSLYGLTAQDTAGMKYGDDIVVVLLKLNSPRYGDYYSYRVVRMYNASDTTGMSPEP